MLPQPPANLTTQTAYLIKQYLITFPGMNKPLSVNGHESSNTIAQSRLAIGNIT